MWMQDEQPGLVESDEDGESSSEDEQSAILETQKDETNQRLMELEEASSQLLREIDVLEIQFQMERSCRESAEALALKMSRENSVLKRASRLPMALIPELPEDEAAVTSDPGTEETVDRDDARPLLESQAKIAELQTIVDGLLTDKLLQEQQIEDLSKERLQLREQLDLQVEEKEAVLREMNKQSRTMKKIKRVSQLVTQEFSEMSQELELQKDLRQHAEDVAHQLMRRANQEPGSDLEVDLQRAMEQVSIISQVLCNIQRLYQAQEGKSGTEDGGVLSQVQGLKEQLETSEEQRKGLERQLSEASVAVAQLQGEVKELQDELNKEDKNSEPEQRSVPLPPPPPPPLPPATNVINSVVLRKKAQAKNAKPNTPDIRANAVDEMMERIKKGIVLRPVSRMQDEDGSWTDQWAENRKSAIMELKGMLDRVKPQPLRAVASRRRRTSRNVEEAELLRVLQRRRRVMEDSREPSTSTQTQGWEPAAEGSAWAGESGSAPVLRRLRQNREERNSRLRASALIISQAD